MKGTTFFSGKIDPITGLSDYLTYFTNYVDPNSNSTNNPSNTPNDFGEVYYSKVSSPSACALNPNSIAKLPKLSDDLSRVWVLENGIKMTGAQIRNALMPVIAQMKKVQ
jgi:hypothetical protein